MRPHVQESPRAWAASGSTSGSRGCSASPAPARADLLAADLVHARRARGRRSPTGSSPARCSRSSSRTWSRPARGRRRAGRRAQRSSTTTTTIVVVDKPVGVAVHPSMGWTGPTVVGHLRGRRLPDRHRRRPRAAGHRAAPRRRHLGRDGDRQVRARLLGAQERLPPPRGRQDLPRAGAGPPRPAAGTIDAPIGRHTSSDWKFAVRDDGKHSVTHYETLEAHRSPACSRCTSRPGAPTRSGCTWPRCSTPASATSPTAPTRRWPPGSVLERQWLHAVRLGFEHPGVRRARRATRRRTPPTWPHALEVIRDAH